MSTTRLTRLRTHHDQQEKQQNNGDPTGSVRRTRNSTILESVSPLDDPPKKAKNGSAAAAAMRKNLKNNKPAESHLKSSQRHHSRPPVTKAKKRSNTKNLTSSTFSTPQSSADVVSAAKVEENDRKMIEKAEQNHKREDIGSHCQKIKNLTKVSIVEPIQKNISVTNNNHNSLTTEDSINLDEHQKKAWESNGRLREMIRNNPDQIVRAVRCQINVRQNGEWEVHVPGDRAMSLKLEALLRQRLGPRVPPMASV